jgi:hypothetical protein
MNYFPGWASHFANYNEGLNQGLSILDLVNSGTVDCKLAAMLWLIMEHRASVLVASGPVYAGKTTLLHTLLDFLPAELEKIALRGYYEDFQFVDYSRPEKSYLVAEEISNHGYAEYLWGLKAIRTFRLLSQGYSLGATMHARTSEEVVYLLNGVLNIPLYLVSRLGIIVNLRATAGKDWEDEPIRRVSSVDLLMPHKDGLAIQVLAARQYTENGFEYQPEKTMQQVLAVKGLGGKSGVFAEIDERKRYLRHLLKKGRSSRHEVRRAIADYRRSRPN